MKVLLTKMQDNRLDRVPDFTGLPEPANPARQGVRQCVPIAATVEADLGAMKNIWVGSSEANMRAFIKTIEAMGGEGSLLHRHLQQCGLPAAGIQGGPERDLVL